MPLFFAISGYLYAFYEKKMQCITVGEYIKRKIVSLLIPFSFFSIINAVILIFIDDSFSLYWSLICGLGMNPLWFIPVLFIIEIIFHYLKNGNNISAKVVISCLVVFAFVYKIKTNKYGVWSVTEVPWFLLCYTIGFYLFLPAMYFERRNQKRIVYIGIASILFLVHYILLFRLILPYNHNYHQQDNDILSYIMRVVIGCFGVVATYFLSRGLTITFLTSMLKYCGKNSIVILSTHMLYLKVFIFCGISSDITAYVSWTVLLPTIWLYNKYFAPFQFKIKNKILT